MLIAVIPLPSIIILAVFPILDTEIVLESIVPADKALILIFPAFNIFSHVVPPLVDENIPFSEGENQNCIQTTEKG